MINERHLFKSFVVHEDGMHFLSLSAQCTHVHASKYVLLKDLPHLTPSLEDQHLSGPEWLGWPKQPRIVIVFQKGPKWCKYVVLQCYPNGQDISPKIKRISHLKSRGFLIWKILGGEISLGGCSSLPPPTCHQDFPSQSAQVSQPAASFDLPQIQIQRQ